MMEKHAVFVGLRDDRTTNCVAKAQMTIASTDPLRQETTDFGQRAEVKKQKQK
jgi:hypothetical protein